MLHIHNKGVGVAGVYTREVAETRVAQVEGLAKDRGHPLQCTMEPE
jgi:ATP-dependent Clp protease adaptor protein ClpS